MKFPLPAGHWFGLNPYDVKVHDGNDSWADEANLKHWQRKFGLLWDREMPVTGRFDGPTQRACLRIQHEFGLPVTAVLDEDTWRAMFDGPKGAVSAEHDVPVGGSTPERVEAPEAIQTPGTSPSPTMPSSPKDEETVPEWFNPAQGPVGPGSQGPTVRKIRVILGLQPRDVWSNPVSERIRGLQKLHSLPVTGWVDTRTAQVLDLVGR